MDYKNCSQTSLRNNYTLTCLSFPPSAMKITAFWSITIQNERNRNSDFCLSQALHIFVNTNICLQLLFSEACVFWRLFKWEILDKFSFCFVHFSFHIPLDCQLVSFVYIMPQNIMVRNTNTTFSCSLKMLQMHLKSIQALKISKHSYYWFRFVELSFIFLLLMCQSDLNWVGY